MPWIADTHPEGRMPKYKFGDEENQVFELIPAGDYPFQVVGVDFGIQNGGKTNGSDIMDLKVKVYKDGTYDHPLAQIFERLIFHKSCLWKIDTFVKASNLLVNGTSPAKDAEIDFNEDLLKGLRGWCTIKIDTFKKADNTEGKSNKVAVWLTNKPKLDRAPTPVEVDDAGFDSGTGSDEDIPF